MARKYSEFAQFVFYSIIGAVIFLLIYSFWFNPEYAERTFENIKEAVSSKIADVQANNSMEEVGIITKCRSQYNEYSRIGEEKWGADIRLITIEKVNNISERDDFYNLYGTSSIILFPNIKEETKVFPIVLIATSMSYPDQGYSYPVIIQCDHNGDITDESRFKLTG